MNLTNVGWTAKLTQASGYCPENMEVKMFPDILILGMIVNCHWLHLGDWRLSQGHISIC